jgi:hypothetical protein
MDETLHGNVSVQNQILTHHTSMLEPEQELAPAEPKNEKNIIISCSAQPNSRSGQDGFSFRDLSYSIRRSRIINCEKLGS